jgi:hypothetical protein
VPGCRQTGELEVCRPVQLARARVSPIGFGSGRERGLEGRRGLETGGKGSRTAFRSGCPAGRSFGNHCRLCRGRQDQLNHIVQWFARCPTTSCVWVLVNVVGADGGALSQQRFVNPCGTGPGSGGLARHRRFPYPL